MQLLNTFPTTPIIFVRAKGCYLYDENGREYLDLLSGVWCCTLGHSHPRFVGALQPQLDSLIHLSVSFHSREIETASNRLAALLPPHLDRVTWLNTGSEAVELALKIARLAAGGDGVVVWEKGYYGATNLAWALSYGADEGWYRPALWPVPAPHCTHCPIGASYPTCDFLCLDQALSSVEEAVAVLYEPVLGSGGVIVPPPGYGRRVQEWARRLGALFILEEVTTGLGRTGRWFGFQHDDLEPDVLVLGKVLGNGLPVAAVITSAEVEARCAGRLRHVQSHQNDPWSGAVAATVIEIIKDEGLIERSATIGLKFLEQLEDLASHWPIVAEARGLGLMVALELSDPQAGSALQSHLLAEGIIADYREHCQCLRFFPPYVIEPDEVTRSVEAIDKGLQMMKKGDS
jgi:2,2-dialkylglycine decarboxylase (pyruvate)